MQLVLGRDRYLCIICHRSRAEIDPHKCEIQKLVISTHQLFCLFIYLYPAGRSRTPCRVLEQIRQDCIHFDVIKRHQLILSEVTLPPKSHKVAAKKYNNCAFGKVIHTQNFVLHMYSFSVHKRPFHIFIFKSMKKLGQRLMAWLYEGRIHNFNGKKICD